MIPLRRWYAVLLCISFLFGIMPMNGWAEDDRQVTNLPTLYITLDNGVDPSSMNKDDYLSAVLSLTSGEQGVNMVEMPLSIKGRGNSTWEQEKKTFALKFSEKTDLFGMGKAKKWVLLANYFDKTLLRNALTLTLGQELGIAYTPEWTFVDLYLNGQYQGNYLLTEKVEIGKERVNIDDENGGVLFEIEQQYRHSDCNYCHETPAGVHLTYKEPEAKDLGEEAIASLMETNNAFLDAFEASIPQGIDSYSEYIDVDSFVNWYILNEFAKNYDSAFVTSCYCYRDGNGKLCMGPPWDYDTCYGNQDVATGLNPVGYHVRQAPWYSLLCQDKDFQSRLMERWTQLTEDGVFARIADWIDEQAAAIADSQQLEQARWPNAMAFTGLRGSGPVYQTFEEEIAYLKDFISRRFDWLDSQWNTGRFGKLAPLTYSQLVPSAVDQVPAPAGMAGESSQNLFDGDPTTKYCTPSSLPLVVEWEMAQPTAVTTYAMATANDSPGRDPRQWILQGSQDRKNWFNLDLVNAGDLPEERFAYREFVVASPGEYRYYRLTIVGVKESDGYTQLSELILGGHDTANLLAVRKNLSALGRLDSLSCREVYSQCTQALDQLTELELPYVNNLAALEAAREYLDQRLGDVDESGTIDAADALSVLQHSVQLISLEGENYLAGDVDGSGILDAVDALQILQRSVKLISSFLP